MEVKYTNTKPKTTKKKTKKKKLKRIGFALLSLLVLGVVMVVLLNTVLFPIEIIKVVNNNKTIYSAEEILNASAVNKGDKLFSINEEKVNQIITAKLPYIKEIKLIKSYPSTITISVTPEYEKYSISHKGQYVIVSDGFKMLNQTVNPSEKTITVTGVEVSPRSKGKTIEFKSEEAKETFTSLISYITKYKITVTAVDVSSSANLKATVNNGISVNFGTSANIDYKIQYLKSILENLDENAKGSIELSYWTPSNPRVYYNRDTEN